MMALFLFFALSFCFTQSGKTQTVIPKKVSVNAQQASDLKDLTLEPKAIELSQLIAEADANYTSAADNKGRSSKKRMVRGDIGSELITEMVYPMPENGLDLNAALQELIEYPQEAIENDIEGVVEVLCMVERDGKVSSVIILQDIGANCANQVCKVVRSIKLKPAMQNGVPRRCAMIVPVRFTLT